MVAAAAGVYVNTVSLAADVATNLFTTASKIYFVCFEKGTWTISYDFASDALAVTGAFAFAS